MLVLARDIIGSHPILTAFLAIGLGYLVGQINIFGFSLGVGAVLFVGLAIGAFAPKAQIFVAVNTMAFEIDEEPVFARVIGEPSLNRHSQQLVAQTHWTARD